MDIILSQIIFANKLSLKITHCSACVMITNWSIKVTWLFVTCVLAEVSSEEAAKLAKDKELEGRYNAIILENGVSE